MAHPICGIDVGAFSIKFVVFEVGFRHTVFRGAFEEMVSDGPLPLLARQVEALREGLSRVSSDATLYLALPGDALSIRQLDLPFTDQRKIDQVIGFELEGQIVHALEDVVFDYVTVRSNDDGSSVLAAAARRDTVTTWLEALKEAGIDPRGLFAAPVVYHVLGIHDPAAEADPGRVPAILDLGHTRTNLFVGRDGQGVFGRAITRGGQHLTAALSQAFAVDRSRAERIKRSEARLIPAGEAPASAAAARIDEVLRGALTPLVREVRQTLASFRAANHLEIGAVYVTGGTARLKGLVPFLESELDLPVVFLTVPNTLQGSASAPGALSTAGAGVDSAGAGVSDATDGAENVRAVRLASESSSFALATAIGVAAAGGGREIDLRRGPFVYRASFSILRQKAAHLALLGAAILVAGGLDVFASLSNLGTERKALDTKLKAATQEVFGAPRSDAKAVAQILRKGFREELAPVPKATAYDLLDQISKRIPSAERIKLDIAELDIKAKKTYIKGTVDSATAVDEIAEKLKEIECYDEVTKGAVTEVSDSSKQFTLNVGSKCP
ncbi:MAG: type II secretion system protein GspL [Bacteroidota bacterium]